MARRREIMPQSHIVHPCLGHQRFFSFPCGTPFASWFGSNAGMKWLVGKVAGKMVVDTNLIILMVLN